MLDTAITPRDLGYRPDDVAFIADPYPAFARLREAAAVLYDEATNQWVVPRFADVNALLRDRRLGRSYLHVATHEEWGRPEPPDWQAPFWALLRTELIDLEPPDHTRLRRLVSQAFTPRTVEALRPRIEGIVAGLVERARAKGDFDLIADLIEELPVTVIAELLGIPPADRALLRPWSADITLMYELNPSEDYQRRATRASAEFADYVRRLARERRADPGSDLLSELARVAEAADRLTEDEVIGTAILLLNAGHEASVNGAGNSWAALLAHPGALADLRARPELVPTAVEELLRFDTPAPMFERWVLEDIEIGGRRILRGEELALLFASANRDPAAFERPDELVLDRRPNPYLSFGAGIHYCLGAPLAKLEAEILFRAMLGRLPTIELVEEPRWKPRFVLRGLEAIHVRVA
ncbi:MAG TPA: cytochrome P450 [Candidatus Limnocylindrales bacterium]